MKIKDAGPTIAIALHLTVIFFYWTGTDARHEILADRISRLEKKQDILVQQIQNIHDSQIRTETILSQSQKNQKQKQNQKERENCNGRLYAPTPSSSRSDSGFFVGTDRLFHLQRP